jgi:phosphate starvation-inducible PhoH-like protein
MTKRRSVALFKEPSNIERQQKRLSKQQKKLDQDIENLAKTAPKPRTINYSAIKRISPLTDTQKAVFDAFDDADNMAFVLYGSAGTGKSFLAIHHALCQVLDADTEYDKIVIIRSTTQCREQGFVKGDNAEKVAPFESPYIAICQELLGRKDAYEKLKDLGKLEFESTAFLRGISFHRAIIVVDEMQNMNWSELSTIAGRVGEHSKIIFCGDGRQDDLNKSAHDVSGFRDFLHVSSKMSEFRSFRFTCDDIVRSSFVKSFIMTCEKLGMM